MSTKAPYAIGDLFSALVFVPAAGTCLAYLRVTSITLNGFDSDGRETWRIDGAGGSIAEFSAIVRADGSDRHGYVQRGLAA